MVIVMIHLSVSTAKRILHHHHQQVESLSLLGLKLPILGVGGGDDDHDGDNNNKYDGEGNNNNNKKQEDYVILGIRNEADEEVEIIWPGGISVIGQVIQQQKKSSSHIKQEGLFVLYCENNQLVSKTENVILRIVEDQIELDEMVRSNLLLARCEIKNLSLSQARRIRMSKSSTFLFPKNRVESTTISASSSSSSSSSSNVLLQNVKDLTEQRDRFKCFSVILLKSAYEDRDENKPYGLFSFSPNLSTAESINSITTSPERKFSIIALAFASPKDSLQKIGAFLHSNICEQLSYEKVEEFISFTPPGSCPILISKSLCITKQGREKIHDRLYFEKTRPMFLPQCSNEYVFEYPEKGILESPHLAIQTTKSSLAAALVQGPYLYYHYTMQGVNDKGWGCAYRSLQTIMSWFLLNNYTSRNPCSIREIQEVIVRITGDNSSFVGSKNWIGSQEVCWVLDELLHVKTRFIHCSQAADIVDHSRELIRHFTEQGTPVLISGGKLALTLLGITLDGEEFLILDPHYTGVDDLKLVVTKSVTMEGYSAIPCGWRKPSQAFVNDGTGYVIAIPERPEKF